MIAALPVSREKRQALHARMRKVGIREQDLEEQFIRAGGPGGQNVNKVSTCVVLTHRPTRLTVRCQTERSQGLNRFLARRRLTEKMEERLLGIASTRRQQQEKMRRQKRKRSKRAKEKLLEQKRHRSTVKARRKRVSPEE